MKRLIVVCVLLVAAGAVAVVTRAGDAPAAAADPAGITVSGAGAVRVAPDQATLTFSVNTQAHTAAAAVAGNGQAMRAVMAALRKAGVTDLKTQSVSLFRTRDGNGAFDGFGAASSVTATVADVARIGTVIDAGVEAGADGFHGPSLTRANRSELYRQALRAAVADARTRAQTLSTAANVPLGRIVQIVEQGGGSGGSAAVVATPASSSTPIALGEQEVRASVSITFATSAG